MTEPPVLVINEYIEKRNTSISRWHKWQDNGKHYDEANDIPNRTDLRNWVELELLSIKEVARLIAEGDISPQR